MAELGLACGFSAPTGPGGPGRRSAPARRLDLAGGGGFGDGFFAQGNLDPQRTLALFPFTQHAFKNYPAFAAALKDFAGWNILLFGGAEMRERCEQLAGELPGNVINLAGRTTLRELTALIRRCRLLVGSDTCGVHIACAVGVSNVVVLAGGHLGRC